MSRGIHTKPNRGRTTTWLTPPDIVRALGPFDIDPCCPPVMPWRTADLMLSNDPLHRYGSWLSNVRFGDGLAVDWTGRRFWLNPPYGATANRDWLRKAAAAGDGFALVAARTEVEDWFWPYVWEGADAVLFLRGRLYYRRPDGARGPGNAGHGSVIAAYGPECVARLRRANIPGRLIELRRAAP